MEAKYSQMRIAMELQKMIETVFAVKFSLKIYVWLPMRINLGDVIRNLLIKSAFMLFKLKLFAT